MEEMLVLVLQYFPIHLILGVFSKDYLEDKHCNIIYLEVLFLLHFMIMDLLLLFNTLVEVVQVFSKWELTMQVAKD
jgi:hypothetical protein